MLKAAIYCRLSDAGPGHAENEAESIQNQKSLLLQYAVGHDMEVEQIYSDEDYSGTDRSRPAFRRMIADAEARRFDVILVKTLSRFTRSVEESELYLHRKFPEWGIRLVAVLDGTDTQDAAAHKSQQLNGLVNEWYLEELSANVQAALASKRQQGKYLASFALYGYGKDPNDRNHLLPNPDTAPIVQRIFALCLAGFGATNIALVLNAEGVPSPSAYKHACDPRYKAPVQARWSDIAVLGILHNPIYTGDMVQGRHKKISYKSDGVTRRPKEAWIVVTDTHAPLIDRETFARAQQVLAMRKNKTGYVPPHRPLARKVICGGCGTGMGASGRKDQLILRCLRNRRDPRLCSMNRIPLSDVEEIVLDRLQEHLAELLNVDRLTLAVCKDDPRRRRRCQQLHQKQQEQRRLEQEVRALYLRRIEDGLPPDDFAAASQRLSQRLSVVKSEVETLSHSSELTNSDELRQKMLPYLQADRLTREMADALIERVTIWPAEEGEGQAPGKRKIEISWKF